MINETFYFVPLASFFDKALEDLNKDFEQQQKEFARKINAFNDNREEVKAVEALLAPFDVRISGLVSYDNSIFLNVWHNSLITSWSDLLPILEALDSIKCSTEWYITNIAETYTRDYTVFVKPFGEEGKKLGITLYASLPGDTEDCKRVVVGYETPYVSEPKLKYEFVCGNQVMPEKQVIERDLLTSLFLGDSHHYGTQIETDIPF